MSLCQKCHKPGSCCKGFALQQIAPVCDPSTAKGIVAEAAQILKDRNLDFFVFDRLERGSNIPDGKVGILWKCTHLGQDGRCTDYDNRPPTCINYQPMDDALCAIRPFKGIPILVERA